MTHSHAHPSSTKQQPHYLQPTTSTILPEYANAEADAIKMSFSTGNYRLLAHLPTELRAHHVSEATANRIDENITSSYFVAPYGSYRKVGGRAVQDGVFSSFDYVSEPYALASKLLNERRGKEEEERRRINPLPFLYATPRPQLINALAGLPSYDENAQYREPYDTYEEQHRRQQYLQNQKCLYGPFIPTVAARSIGDDKVIRKKLPEIIRKLMDEIDRDWSDCEFQIYADPDDLIILQFSVASLDDPKGLLTYMNTFINQNPVVSEYALSKLVELWNHSSDDGVYLYYCLKPPWLARRPEESMYRLHPELGTPGGTYLALPEEERSKGLLHSARREKQARLKGEGASEEKEYVQQRVELANALAATTAAAAAASASSRAKSPQRDYASVPVAPITANAAAAAASAAMFMPALPPPSVVSSFQRAAHAT